MPLSFFQEVDSVIYGEEFPHHGYWHWQHRGRNIPRSLEFHDKKTMPKSEASASETVGFFLPFEPLKRRHEPLDHKKIFDPKIAKLRRLKVTLKEIKHGAYKHVSHVKGAPPKNFNDMFFSPLFDVMIYRLIQYMEADERLKEFVDEQTREALRQRALKKQGILNAPPAIGAFDQIKHDETEAMLKNNIVDICSRIGEIYGGFLIGLRMDPKFHHMQKGRTFFSNKKMETDLYEFLYVFLTQFIWLLYDCKDNKLLTIRQKVTEIFRTEMFNFGARNIHSKTTYGDVVEGVVSRHPQSQWAPPQRALEEEWARRPRKKLLNANSIAVSNYTDKLLGKTKDEMKRLDIFADDAPTEAKDAGSSSLLRLQEAPSTKLLRCLEGSLNRVGILGDSLFSFDPETMKRLKERTSSPEKMLYSYLDQAPRATTTTVTEMSAASTISVTEVATEGGEEASTRETGVRFTTKSDHVPEKSAKSLEIEKKKMSKRSIASMISALSSEKDFIGNEELSKKNIEELENKIDLFHRSIREIRTKRVPGANMETTLLNNGFVLPIYSDEVVTKKVEPEEEATGQIVPPKYVEVSGDPILTNMADGRQFALWRRKQWRAAKRCPKTGKVID